MPQKAEPKKAEHPPFELRQVGNKWQFNANRGRGWQDFPPNHPLLPALAEVVSVTNKKGEQVLTLKNGKTLSSDEFASYALRHEFAASADSTTEVPETPDYYPTIAEGALQDWKTFYREQNRAAPEEYYGQLQKIFQSALQGVFGIRAMTAAVKARNSGEISTTIKSVPRFWDPELFGDYSRATPADVQKRYEQALLLPTHYGAAAREMRDKFDPRYTDKSGTVKSTTVPDSGTRLYWDGERWQKDPIPTIDEQFNKAVLAGEFDRARALANLRDKPTDAKLFDIAMQYTQSPGDSFIMQNLQRGLARLDVAPGSIGFVPRQSFLTDAYNKLFNAPDPFTALTPAESVPGKQLTGDVLADAEKIRLGWRTRQPETFRRNESEDEDARARLAAMDAMGEDALWATGHNSGSGATGGSVSEPHSFPFDSSVFPPDETGLAREFFGIPMYPHGTWPTATEQSTSTTLPGFAQGGTTFGGPIIVGEEGPEVITNAPPGLHVVPVHVAAAAQMLRDGIRGFGEGGVVTDDAATEEKTRLIQAAITNSRRLFGNTVGQLTPPVNPYPDWMVAAYDHFNERWVWLTPTDADKLYSSPSYRNNTSGLDIYGYQMPTPWEAKRIDEAFTLGKMRADLQTKGRSTANVENKAYRLGSDYRDYETDLQRYRKHPTPAIRALATDRQLRMTEILDLVARLKVPFVAPPPIVTTAPNVTNAPVVTTAPPNTTTTTTGGKTTVKGPKDVESRVFGDSGGVLITGATGLPAAFGGQVEVGHTFANLMKGQALRQPGSLLNAVGLRIPSAQAQHRMSPLERDEFMSLSKIATGDKSGANIAEELKTTIPGAITKGLFSRLPTRRTKLL